MRRQVGIAAGLVLVLAALGLVMLGSRSDATRFTAPTVATSAPAVTATPTADTSSTAGQGQNAVPQSSAFKGFALFIFVLVLLLVAAFVLLLVPQVGGRPFWRWHRRAGFRPESDEPAEKSTRALAEAVDRGLREVDLGGVGDAIVACWLRLERAAAEAGTARRAAETAGELTARVLAAHRVTPATLRRLADLYREARFSGHTLGEPERDQARQALEQVRRELHGHTGDGVPAGPAVRPAAGGPR